jgi:hypothetical protein
MSNFTWADELGRSMARTDMEKNAYARELASSAAHAGQELAKTANPMLAGLGAKMLDFAKKNPGVAIGGGLGALHGLTKHDGGVGSALTEGAMGAGLGYGGQMAMQHPAARATVDVAKERVMSHPPVARFIGDVKERMKTSSIASEFAAIAEDEKVAFGAAIAGALRSAVPAAMNFVKSNPLKAGLGAASAFGNFRSARQNGEGIGGALLSGAAGAASAL